MSYIPGTIWAASKTTPTNEGKEATIQDYIVRKMKKAKMTQREVAEMAHISEYKLSRILNNSNGHGGPYRWDEKTIYAIAIALHCRTDEVDDMISLAFPERALWRQALRDRDTMDTLNALLADQGYPTF